MTTYNKQAEDFLTATETGFFTDWYKHDFYFPEDKETRDIWKITLRSKTHTYKFKFGQSIASAGQVPTPYDVLTCLTKSDPGTFKNFCDEYGYDTDSRSAFKTYKAVMKEWKNVQLLFTEDQLSEAGFLFASAKKAWFFRSEEYKAPSGGKSQTLDQIKTKYGSQLLTHTSKPYQQFLAR